MIRLLSIYTLFFCVSVLLANPVPNFPIKFIIAPATITDSGNYNLANDIVGTITIAANNVTLSLEGRRISGSDADFGIVVDNQANIIIKNGFIEECVNAMDIQNSENVTVENMYFFSSQKGIIFDTCNDVVIKQCRFSDIVDTTTATGAIRINNSESGAIESCVMQRNRGGLFFSNTIGFAVSNLSISDGINTSDGIMLETNCTGIVIKECIISNNTRHGIFFNAVGVNSIENCSVIGNSENGINISGSSNDNVINNTTCNSNGTHGISIDGSDNVIGSNTCYNNTSNGITLLSSSNAITIQNNVFSNNMLHGMSVAGSSHTIENNTINLNSMNGIDVTSDSHFIQNNILLLNSGDGINLNSGSSMNSVVNNSVQSNTNAGIRDDGSNNSFFQNKAQGNGTNYVNVPDVIQSTYSFAAQDFVSTSSIATFNNLSIGA